MRFRAIDRACLAAIAIVKLALVRDLEIIAGGWESTQLAIAVTALFGELPSLFPPGMPLIAAAFQTLGIPLRLGTEMAYLASGALLVSALLPALGSRVAGIATFAVLALHPWTFDGFSTFSSGGFVAVLAMLTLASTAQLARRDLIVWRDPWLWIATCLLLLWHLTRIEPVATIVTWFVMTALLARRPGTWRARGEIALLAAPLLFVGIGHLATERWAASTTGVATLAAERSPGFTSLLSALYRIDSGDGGLFIPVSRSALTQACAASPTLNRACDSLLDPDQQHTRRAEAFTGKPGEFGTNLGRLLFSGFPSGAEEREAALLAATRELDQALDSGELPSRTAMYPIHPGLSTWLPHVPSLVWNSFRQWMGSVDVRGQTERFLHEFSTSQTDRIRLDIVANRRPYLAIPVLLGIDGSLPAGQTVADQATLVRRDGTVVAAGSIGAKDGAARFRLRAELLSVEYLRLVLSRDGVEVYSNLVATLGRNQRTNVEGVPLQIRTYGHPAAGVFDEDHQRRQWVAEAFPWMLVGLGLLTFGVLSASGTANTRQVNLALSLALSLVGTRIVYYGFLKANLGPEGFHHAADLQPLLVPIVALVAAVLAGLARRITAANR